MPVVNQMNALSDAERQQAYDLLNSTWAGIDPATMSAFGNYWNSYSDPYQAWIDTMPIRAALPGPSHAGGGEGYYGVPGEVGTADEWGNFTLPSNIDLLKGWAANYAQPYTGEGATSASSGYTWNPAATGIFGNEPAGASFIPLEYLKKNEAYYKSIDPNFDLSQIKTINHPVIGPVVLPQDIPQLDQTTGEELGEMAKAAAGVAAGAMGISGFAGLHGLPGIDSLFSGFSNLFGSGSSGAGGGAAGAVDPWLGSASTWTPEAIQGYLSQALGSAPISGNALLEEMANLGVGDGSAGGMISSLGGGSSNPVQALTQALQGQVDAGVITPSQMSSALQSVSSTGSTGSSWLDSLLGNSSGGGLMSGGWNSILSGGLQALGGLLTGNQATDAAESQADAYLQAAKIAADAAKFKPVGVTTRFGSSNFGYDANGNLTNAGYQLSPDIKAQQTSLMGASDSALQQYLAAQGATAPMGQTAQTLFGLGQGYLGTSPQDQAAQYMAEQQALLAPTRERDFAALENRLRAQGRLGLATGATSTGLGAANPELESFYNAQRMQDLNLAAQATQGGMDYAKFGAGLVGTGGDMLKSMYGTQTAAYDPYKTAIGGASMLEGLGQNAMDLGINIGAKGTAANAQSGMLLSQGMTNAANAMAPANAYSPWGSLLSGAGTMLGNYGGQQQQNQQYKFDPYTGQQIRWN